MKIIVLHGDDTQKSYLRLTKFMDTAHERGWEITIFDVESKSNLTEIISSNSLFGETRFLIAKNLKLIKPKEIEWIKKNKENYEGTLVLYSNTPLTITALKKFGKIDKIEEYKLPKILYEFLDNLGPDDPKKSLKLFNKLVEKEAPEFIFAIIARQFKDLFWVKNANNGPFPSWKLGNLKRQASAFDNGKLKKLITTLAEIDYKSKTGQANTKDELDLFISTKLK